MKVGSLFTGVGGIDLGLERSGHTIVWQVERDKQARSILRKHWPDTPIYDDVQTVGGTDGGAGRTILEDVDLICGGFPCQDLSVAGNRRGLAGEKSQLWHEFHRILEELRPKYCLVENVPGLLSSNQGRDMEVVLKGLEDLGYQWQYRVLNSQYFGVPQRRRRVFIVGYLGGGCQPQVLLEREGLSWHPATSREEGQGSTRESGDRSAGGGEARSFQWQASPQQTMSITENTPYLSTTKVPAVYRASGFSSYKEDTVATTLRANQQKQTDTDLVLPRIFTQNSRDEVRYVNGDGQLTGALAAHPGVKQQNYVTTYHPLAPTLFASGAGTERVASAGSEAQFIVGNRPRRLTPRECERLQGFPDDWTRFADTGEEIADGPRYRMMGNAVTVNVAEFIGSQLKQVEDIDG